MFFSFFFFPPQNLSALCRGCGSFSTERGARFSLRPVCAGRCRLLLLLGFSEAAEDGDEVVAVAERGRELLGSLSVLLSLRFRVCPCRKESLDYRRVPLLHSRKEGGAARFISQVQVHIFASGEGLDGLPVALCTREMEGSLLSKFRLCPDIHCCPFFEEGIEDLHLLLHDRDHQGSQVVLSLRVNVSPRTDQEEHRLHRSRLHRQVNRHVSVLSECVHVCPPRSPERLHRLSGPLLSSQVKGREVLLVLRVRPCSRLEESQNDLAVPIAGRLVQRRASSVSSGVDICSL
mmetsp:Transcript_26977/g.52937  ORF Transcript_26977/g.52937 Transcript_26977/m.52937 type:complete len:290 (-) Transcript_26977:168-1037(-)